MQKTLKIYDNAGYSEQTCKQKYQVLATQEAFTCLGCVDSSSRLTPSDVITAFELWLRAHLSCVDIGFGCVDADVEGLLLENRWHQLWLEAQREL